MYSDPCMDDSALLHLQYEIYSEFWYNSLIIPHTPVSACDFICLQQFIMHQLSLLCQTSSSFHPSGNVDRRIFHSTVDEYANDAMASPAKWSPFFFLRNFLKYGWCLYICIWPLPRKCRRTIEQKVSQSFSSFSEARRVSTCLTDSLCILFYLRLRLFVDKVVENIGQNFSFVAVGSWLIFIKSNKNLDILLEFWLWNYGHKSTNSSLFLFLLGLKIRLIIDACFREIFKMGYFLPSQSKDLSTKQRS